MAENSDLRDDSDFMDADIHELAAPYALDALDEDDRVLFERHLPDCARCATEVTSFRQTAAAMAYAVETAPPPELRARLLDAARTERRHERSNVVSFPRWLRFRVPALGAVAAVAAVAALALGIWNLSLTGTLDEERSASAATEQALALVADTSAERISLEGAEGSLVVARDGAAALVVCQLGTAPSGKTFEAWVIDGGGPHRAGEFEGGGHCGAHALTETVPRGATVAVTIEPDGGVDSPTGEPILASESV